MSDLPTEVLPPCVYRLLQLLDDKNHVSGDEIPADLIGDACQIAYNRGLIQTYAVPLYQSAARHVIYRRSPNMPFWLTEAGKDALAIHRAREDEGRDQKPNGRKRQSGNEARDRYCYTQLKAGKALKEIQQHVNDKKGWEPLETTAGVSQAASRYAKRHGLDWPI
jgi:hypothetical protein